MDSSFAISLRYLRRPPATNQPRMYDSREFSGIALGVSRENEFSRPDLSRTRHIQ